MQAGLRFLACFALLMYGSLPTIGFAQSPCPGIHVEILNVRNSTGTIDCALFCITRRFPERIPALSYRCYDLKNTGDTSAL
jgi:hypothetical protein